MKPRNLVRRAPITIEPETRDWTTDAACSGYPPELWYPADSDTETQTNAVRICRTCPVRRACLIDAMTAEKGRQVSTRWGIWGGYTPVERVMLERMQGQGERRATSEAGVQLDNPECQVELTHNKKAAPAGNRSLTATTIKES